MIVFLLKSEGDKFVLTMDYMIKFEEFRMRESSRDYCSKIGSVAYSVLLRHKKSDEHEVKKSCCVVVEGNGTQDSKDTL